MKKILFAALFLAAVFTPHAHGQSGPFPYVDKSAGIQVATQAAAPTPSSSITQNLPDLDKPVFVRLGGYVCTTDRNAQLSQVPDAALMLTQTKVCLKAGHDMPVTVILQTERDELRLKTYGTVEVLWKPAPSVAEVRFWVHSSNLKNGSR